MISPIFRSLRPRHWIKNLLLITGLLLSEKRIICSWDSWLYFLFGFLAFCGLTGSVYLLNDIIDLASDRIHPIKCNRPIASGLLSMKEAKAALILILIISLLAAWFISPLFFSVGLGYFMLNLAYSFILKKKQIIDVICIGFGYVLRSIAGIGALKPVYEQAYLPNTIILSIFFFSIFIAFLKQRQEIVIVENRSVIREKDFSNYTIEFIDQVSPLLAGLSIVFYSFFTLTPGLANDESFTNWLIYSIPILLYICLRILNLVCNENDSSTLGNLVIKDKTLYISGILIVLIMVIAKIY